VTSPLPQRVQVMNAECLTIIPAMFDPNQFAAGLGRVMGASYRYHDGQSTTSAAPAAAPTQGTAMKLNDTDFIVSEQQVSIDVLLENCATGDEHSIDDVRRRLWRWRAAPSKSRCKR
jgi:hypothetical protein